MLQRWEQLIVIELLPAVVCFGGWAEDLEEDDGIPYEANPRVAFTLNPCTSGSTSGWTRPSQEPRNPKAGVLRSSGAVASQREVTGSHIRHLSATSTRGRRGYAL